MQYIHVGLRWPNNRRRTLQLQNRGFDSRQSHLIKNRPAWATGDDNGASAHSAVNEYLTIDRDGNCT